MINNILLTGNIGVGKSTIIRNILKVIDVNCGGYIEKKCNNGDIEEIRLISLIDNKEEGIIAIRNIITKEVIGNTEVFDTLGSKCLERSSKLSKLIIMDEIGFLEAKALLFRKAILDVLDSEKFVLGVIKDDYCKNEFLESIRKRKDVMMIRINEKNRDGITPIVLEYLIHSELYL